MPGGVPWRITGATAGLLFLLLGAWLGTIPGNANAPGATPRNLSIFESAAPEDADPLDASFAALPGPSTAAPIADDAFDAGIAAAAISQTTPSADAGLLMVDPIAIYADGRSATTLELFAAPGLDDVVVEFRAESALRLAGGGIAGLVRDASGDLAAAVWVAACGLDRRNCKGQWTALDGSYYVTLPSATYLLYIVADGTSGYLSNGAFVENAPEPDTFSVGDGILSFNIDLPVDDPAPAFRQTELERTVGEFLQLRDDGAGGDREANDGVYTARGVRFDATFPHDGGRFTVLRAIAWTRNPLSGEVTRFLASRSLGLVRPGERVLVSAAGRITFTSNAIVYQDAEESLLSELPRLFSSRPKVSEMLGGCQICPGLYAVFPDSFEFLGFHTRRPLFTPGLGGLGGAVRNNVSGIGLRTFSSSAVSAWPTLLGNFWETEPALRGGTRVHEMMHRWILYLASRAPNHALGEATANPAESGHYSPAIDYPDFMLSGRQGDVAVRDGESWRRATVYELTRASPLTLYLSGLGPAADVPEISVLRDLAISEDGGVSFSGRETYTIEDIQALLGGPRRPAFPDRDTFRLALVTYTQEPLTDAEYAYLTFDARRFASDEPWDWVGPVGFAHATRGRGSVATAVPAPNAPASVYEPPAPTLTDAGSLVLKPGKWVLEGTNLAGVSTVRLNGVPGTIDWVSSRAIALEVPQVDGGPGTLEFVEALGRVTQIAVLVDAPSTHITALQPGWNLVGWNGGDGLIADVLAPLANGVTAAFRWDAAAQRFAGYNPALPRFLNTLRDVGQGDGLWLQVNRAVDWEQPLPAPSRVDLAAGFNLVRWAAADGASVADTIAPLGSALEAVFTWDALAQRFLTYRPGQPAFLNTATAFRTGEGVWVRMARAATWDQAR